MAIIFYAYLRRKYLIIVGALQEGDFSG